jgi:hypothetical protein
MKITVNTHGITEVEHNIAPPMSRAITLPIMVDIAALENLAIYVVGPPGTTDARIREVAQEIAIKLQRKNP